MNKDSEQLVNNLLLLTEGKLTADSFKKILNPNYTDKNGNSVFHFLAEYSLEHYYKQNVKSNNNSNKYIINENKYNEIKTLYKNQINTFTDYLLNFNCDILKDNNKNQNPLIYSLTKNNYIISKKYYEIYKKLELFNEKEYYQNIFSALIINGNTINKDWIEIMFDFISLNNKNRENIINQSLLNKEIDEIKLTPIVFLCKNFGENIYEKYNDILKLKSIDYFIKDNSSIINTNIDQNILNEIKQKALDELNNLIDKYFFPLIQKMIYLGSNIHFYEDKHKSKQTSAFMYLMKYPFFSNISDFIKDNKININYEDYSGNTALNYLLFNKEKITKISKKIFDNAFSYLINNIKEEYITKLNQNEESIFGFCLNKEYFDEVKIILNKFGNLKQDFCCEILIFILEKIRIDDIEKIESFFNFFKNVIDFNLFNQENKRSLLHYICLYLSGNDIDLYLFQQMINLCINLKIDFSLKDKFNRNALYYFFLDENDHVVNIISNEKFEYLLKNNFFKDLNSVDIFGNNLLDYAVTTNSVKCVKLLINSGISLNINTNKNENSIFVTALLNENMELFMNLYNIKKDPYIFGLKIYTPFEINKKEDNENIFKEKNEIGKTLHAFLNKTNNDERKKLFIGKNQNQINNLNQNFLFKMNLNNNNNINKKFDIFNYLEEQMKNLIEIKIKNILIKNDIDNNNTNIFQKGNNSINIFDINPNNKDNIIFNFNNNYDEYISERINGERKIIANDLFSYFLAKNNDEMCKFIIKEKYNLISICYDLILFNKFKDIDECVKIILSDNNNDQNKLNLLKNDKEQTIYHLLPSIQNNLNFCKILSNHNISNIFDIEGNTPMYYACKNFNIFFIETFSHYSFNSLNSNNNKNNVNYDLFMETKNKESKTPLEVLYEKLNKKDNNIMKLIIDISYNLKKVYIIPVIKYLIQNYNSINDNSLNLKRQNSIEHYGSIIKLYNFYTKELKGSIMVKDEFGNDPFFICAESNNFNFLFNVLLEEHNILLNSTNKEGKSIIHLIVDLSGYLNNYKEEILKQAIESGFDFNIKDQNDMLPIDFAYLEQDNNVINILINYYKNYGIEVPPNRHIKPKDKIYFNFNKDSDALFNESIIVSAKIDKTENLTDLICDSFKNYIKNNNMLYQVCVEENNFIPYNANLVKLDLINFNDIKICIQLIENILYEKNNKEYLLILEENNNYKHLSYNNMKDGVMAFKQLFKEKTGNNWDDIKNNKKNFKTDYLKYYIFDNSYEEENAIYDYLKITIKNLYIKKNIEFNGDDKIKNLIYNFLVSAYHNKFSIEQNQCGNNNNNNSIENQTREIIKKYKYTAVSRAANILREIKNLLNQDIKDEINIKKRMYLINSYNDLIPYSQKSTDINLFNNPREIDNEISRLTTYYYIENVLKIFLGAIYNLDKIHPLDYVINCLGCEIKEIPKPNNTDTLQSEADYIYNFLYTTGASKNQIKSIYKITKSKHDKNFNLKNYENRFIFCHGTKVENFIGILSQGLKIAPVQAKFTGSAYGTGIYLSDSFSVSLGYCRANYNYSNKNNKIYMLLVEVAVGNVGPNDDTNIVSMSLKFNDAFITNEGYGIFINSQKVNASGVIVARDETNVRVKYIVEIQNNYF